VTAQISEGYAVAVPLMRTTISAFLDGTAEHDRDSHWLWLACNATADLWDGKGGSHFRSVR
jgi:hypothetical protein